MKKKSSITSKLRNAFIAGIVVLVPIGFTLYLTLFLIKISSKLIPNEINPNNYLPFSIPGLEILLSVIFITIVGGISLSFFGKKILNLINDLFKRIPILRTIYSAIGQMTESFTSKSDNKTSKELINVFVPTTPNPTSGFLLMFPKDEVIYLDMTFEEASKFIVSAGTSDPADN